LHEQIILDSGATDHMFCNKRFLTNLEPINYDQYVIVANGVKVKINGKGDYNIFSTKNNDILYVNTFTTNLLSINKLTQQLNYNVIFSKRDVIFQDRETGETIGEGSLENGLYVLKSQRIFCAMTKLKDSDILHRRLGHPSDKILNSFLKFSLKEYIDCDVCKLAKQTRLHFSLSNSKSEALFDLIYIPIYGDRPQLFHIMDLDILLYLLMTFQDQLGCIY
jgi:GAG-pre-integrase domain